ncbi:MAG: GTPase Era [Ruminococcaceae bacterium]|nr:GTPase Era [Oscillospiraceae bacterium]
MNQNDRSAFIAIVGRPNVGKSSILNRILGEKIAIVTNKPQTTRTRIMGVLTEGEHQLVFTDTPGMHKARTSLGKYMVKSVTETVSGADACLLVVDAQEEVSDTERDLIERMKVMSLPCVLAINKTDKVKEKSSIMKVILDYTQLYDFEAVVPVSAKKGEGISELVEELKKLTNEGGHFFDADTLTDQPERQLAAEMLREKLLLSLDKEIPHGTAVVIEKMRQRDDGILDIEATIYCERDSHKGIIIGKGGSMLKKVSSKARADMESFFDCKVNLQTWVKVKEDWRNRDGLLRNFGFDSSDFS